MIPDPSRNIVTQNQQSQKTTTLVNNVNSIVRNEVVELLETQVHQVSIGVLASQK